MLHHLTHFLGLVSFPTWLFCGIITAHADFFIDHSHRMEHLIPKIGELKQIALVFAFIYTAIAITLLKILTPANQIQN